MIFVSFVSRQSTFKNYKGLQTVKILRLIRFVTSSVAPRYIKLTQIPHAAIEYRLNFENRLSIVWDIAGSRIGPLMADLARDRPCTIEQKERKVYYDDDI